jgi:small redox-active disulfide protein 2
MLRIKILGPGCPKCQTLEKLAKRALEELKIDAIVEHVNDVKEIVKYTMTTPALVINEKLKIQGVPPYPKVKEVIEEEIKGV